MKLLYFLLLVIAYTPLQASESHSGIKISIPDEYCLLDANEPSDNRVLTTFDRQAKGKHRRLAFMVNCDQLISWRKGDILTLDDFGYILLPEEYVDQNENKALDEFLNDMVDEIGHGRKNIIRHRGDGYQVAKRHQRGAGKRRS